MVPTAATSPAPSRADRLLREARNCLVIAIDERDTRFAALLIDEAARLCGRARELRHAG